MKRIISFVLILVLLFSLASLASCGDEQSKSKSPTSSASSKKPASSEKGDKSEASVSSELSSAEVSSAVSSNASSKPSSNPSSTSSKPVSSAVSSVVSSQPTPEELALKNSGTVEIYSFTDFYDDKGRRLDKYFKDNYAGTVVRREKEWESWENAFIKDFAANDAPDVITLSDRIWPKAAMRNMVYNTNELLEKGVLGLDNSYLSDSTELNSKSHSYKGEVYGIGTYKNNPNVLLVNDTLLKNCGVKKLPIQYYSEGVWNFENFTRVCAQVTLVDKNNDGVLDYSAYHGWNAGFILEMNGARMITLESTGKLKNNIESADVIEGLEAVKVFYGVLKIASSLSDGTEDFKNGKIAMIAYDCAVVANKLKNIDGDDGKGIKFDYSVVPLPPTANNKDFVSGTYESYAVTKQSENLQGAVNFIIAAQDFKSKDQQFQITNDIEHWIDDDGDKMIDLLRSKNTPTIFNGVGNLWNTQWDFWTNIKSQRTPVSEVVAVYKPMFDAQIKAENDAAVK